MYYPDPSINSLVKDSRFFFPLSKKFQDLTRLNVRQEYSSRNAYIIRLAEMYLIVAEASYMLNNTEDAYNFLLTLADARSYSGDGAALLSSYGINSGGDIDIEFILDERARELAGEQLRWFDLKRTRLLVRRVRDYNPDERYTIASYHNLRRIPEYIVNQGYPQNPGYPDLIYNY